MLSILVGTSIVALVFFFALGALALWEGDGFVALTAVAVLLWPVTAVLFLTVGLFLLARMASGEIGHWVRKAAA